MKATQTLHFSPRQAEVLAGLARGQKTREIAAELHLSPKTVESYYGNLRHALGLQGINQLIVYSVYHAIYDP